MSTMSVASPEDESHFLLILGKPGGGKGTISKKILKVSIWLALACSHSLESLKSNVAMSNVAMHNDLS